jgi:ABC-type multidrug transport system permease subunit
MRSKAGWIAAAVGAAAVFAVAVAITISWNGMGVSEISWVGWLAMAFGVLATLGLGIGLMALMFYSSRHGYDEAGHKDC